MASSARRGFYLALDIQRHLLSQKQVLSGELGMRSGGCGYEPHEVAGDPQDIRTGVQHRNSVMAAGSYGNSEGRQAFGARGALSTRISIG